MELNFDAPLVFLERFWGVVTRADCCFVEDPDHTLLMHFDLPLCFARNQFQLEIFSSERKTANPKQKKTTRIIKQAF